MAQLPERSQFSEDLVIQRQIPVFILAIFLLALATCSPVSEPVTIRIGVLPILDSLPIYVAQDQGYFEAEGVSLEFVPVASAPERDQLMQAGQLDAMINEVVSVLLYNRQEVKVVAVRFARTATAEHPVFRIVASADSGILDLEGLENTPIGISEGTVIEYTTDRLLQRAGFAPEEIAKVAVPKIPDRLNLLASGQLAAANLPDPAASMAILNGACLIIDDTSYPEISHSVISFSKAFVDQHPEGVKAFLRAFEKAVDDINADPTAWDELLLDEGLLPPPLLGAYRLPPYPAASVPSQAQFADALAWAQGKGIVEGEVRYEGSIDGSFLP